MNKITPLHVNDPVISDKELDLQEHHYPAIALVIEIETYDYDNSKPLYTYDQACVLESALDYFENAIRSESDLRSRRIAKLKALNQNGRFNVVISSDERQLNFRGPAYDCLFLVEGSKKVLGIFDRYSIQFRSDEVLNETSIQLLVDFIDKHTPSELPYLIERE